MHTECFGRPRVWFILLFSASLLSLAGCQVLELESGWRNKEITIDGKSTEWHDAMIYLEKAGILVGFLNDEANLYACLVADSPFLRANLLRQGFTVWFDPAGGSKKTFGIRFPIGRQRNFDKEKRGEEPEPFGPDRYGREDEPDEEEMQEFIKKTLTELEILGPGKNEAKRMPLSEAIGIEISLVPSSGLLVYELKIPLVQSEQHPYAVGALPGKIIGLGLESPKINLERGMRGMGGGMPGGGLRPPMGGGPGPGGSGGGWMMPEAPKELKLWAKVSLAPGPSSK
ncbi:MAG: hypothetical protein WCB96_10505 [Candidatus Aminicenantales bacterium]